MPRSSRRVLMCTIYDIISLILRYCTALYYILLVQVASNQVINEMVLDGGGHFSPAGIDGVHTLSLLLLSQTAHDRAEGNQHTHTHTLQPRQRNVGTVQA